jgi:hypothetical protein
MDLLWLAAGIAAFLAVLFILLALAAFFRRRLGGGLVQILLGLVCLGIAAALATVAVGMGGYRALTAERTAATVEIERAGEQRFTARFTFPDGEATAFELAGDQLYVDARILKWHPRANLLGLQSAYRLDRVGGRYLSLDDEQTAPRTVYSLADDRPVDLFSMARRYQFLQPLVDAEYGSATFLSVRHGGTYQLQVSNSGLLIREFGTAR